MRALLQPRFGGVEVLEYAEVGRPEVGADDVLVRVKAVSLNFGDRMMLEGLPYLFRPVYGWPRPSKKVAGLDAAGVVEAVGANVTRFTVGDEVMGELTRGSLAEYALAYETEIAPKPANLSFEEAATIPVAGLTAWGALHDTVKPGHAVLINGASGGVGTFAIQLAKAQGATVTAVCSTAKVDQARELGADAVIDYTKQDYVDTAERFDVLLDLVGNFSMGARQGVLKPDGVYVSSFGQGGSDWFGPLFRIFGVVIRAVFRPRRIKLHAATPSGDYLRAATPLFEGGAVRPCIERRYGFDEAVDAFRYLLEGHVRGKLVITV